MNQTKKLWFFVEGHSEENFVLVLIRKYFPNFKICKSPSDILKNDPAFMCYVHNSKGEGRLPFDVAKNMHFIDRGEVKNIFLICDVETSLNCPIEKKGELINKAKNVARRENQTLNLENFSFVISAPTIESIYCSEKEIVTEILQADYIKIFGSPPSKGFNLNMLDDRNHTPQTNLQMLFRKHRLHYDKRRFSERFFGNLDYQSSVNKVVQRLYRLIESTLE